MVTPKPRLQKRRRYALLAFAALLVLAAGFFGVRLLVHHTSNNTSTNGSNSSGQINSIDYSPSTTQETTPNDNRKSSRNPSDTLNGSSSQTANNPLTTKIVSANISGTNVHIGTLVGGTTTGNCTLTANQSGTQISLASSQVQQDVNNYSCGVFNIPTSKFPSSGSWQLVLTVSAGTNQASDSVNLTVPKS